MKDRETSRVSAAVISGTDAATLQSFVGERVAADAMVYTDEHSGYRHLPHHETIRHSVGEYVNGQAHPNGIESFWATLKRGYHGTDHQMSAKHLGRYVGEFAGRHNDRPLETIDQLRTFVRRMVGKRLRYAELTA